MNTLRSTLNRFRTDARWAVCAGAMFMIFSVAILVDLSLYVRNLRDTAIPLASVLPDFEQRIRVLSQQVELAELNATLQGGSPKEFVHAYVLPDDSDIDRLIGFFDLVRNVLTDRKVMYDMSSITFDTAYDKDTLLIQPFLVTMEVNKNGLRQIGVLLENAGRLTIGDVLTIQDKTRLLRFSEEENPASIVSLEQFFSADVLRYAQDPKSHEEQVRRSFVSSLFDREFSYILKQGVLRDVREVLGGELGLELLKSRLWPIRFLIVDLVAIKKIQDDRFEVSLTLHAYSRTK